jgi:hypothetical protein
MRIHNTAGKQLIFKYYCSPILELLPGLGPELLHLEALLFVLHPQPLLLLYLKAEMVSQISSSFTLSRSSCSI